MYLLVILTRSIVSLIVFATSEKSEKNEANNSELIFIHFIYSIIKEEEEEEVSSTISSTKIGRDESCSIVVASSSTYTYPDEPRFDEVAIEEKKVEDDYSDFR